MIIKDDWHIHSEHSCDQACMKMEDLVTGAADKGISRYGITDHVHTPYNYPDILRSRKAYDANRNDEFVFGVEVSCVSQWELEMISKGTEGNLTYGIREGGPPGGPYSIGIDDEFIAVNGIEYVVAGTHWPMYVEHRPKDLIEDYHRQNMYLSGHRSIDVIAHPWWCLGPCEDSWINDFSIIPNSMHNEFAASCIENNKLVEINLSAMLLTRRYTDEFKAEYMEYLIMLRELGVNFSIGSDCHNEYYDIDFKKASKILESAGFTSSDFLSPVR